MKLLSLENYCFCIFLFFLPFTQALTLNVGFPLKISEIFLILVFILWLIRIIMSNIQLTVSRLQIILAVFVFLILVSTVINIFWQYPYDLNLNASRINPAADSFLKFGYVILVAIAFIVTTDKTKHSAGFTKYLLYGAIVSCCYSWYLLFSTVLKLPVFLLPGMDKYPQLIALPFGNFIRSGTFKEGNYLGFYILLSAIVALYQNKRGLSLFFFISIITSFSTIAFACGIIFWIIYLLRTAKRKANLVYIIIVSSIVTGILLFVIFNQALRSVFISKIFFNEETANIAEIYSTLDRLNVAEVGLRIFYNNPFWGVGLSNYGLHYYHYNMLDQWIYASGVKRIPNNIYIEILCETGIFVFITFILFLWALYKKTKAKNYFILNAAIIICCIYFLAFPTFTALYVWVFWGIIMGRVYYNNITNEEKEIGKLQA